MHAHINTQKFIETSIPHFIVLHFFTLHRHCIFYKLKICGKSASAIFFSTVFARFMSLSHTGISHSISCLFIIIIFVLVLCGPPLVAQLVKNLPAMLEIPVQFLGREDSLEKG